MACCFLFDPVLRRKGVILSTIKICVEILPPYTQYVITGCVCRWFLLCGVVVADVIVQRTGIVAAWLL